MVKLAIFDLDGTLLDTLDDLRNAVNFALEAHGFPPRTREEVRRFVGNGVRLLVERAVPAGCGAAATDAVFETFMARYAAHCADMTAPYPGIPETLAALRDAGIRIAVVTNKADAVAQTVCADYFPGLPDLVVGERPGIRRKPAPDAVNEVLRHFGVSRGEAVYIGDSDVDIATAQNAGLRAVAVLWGFRTREELLACGAERFAADAAALQNEILFG